MKRQFSTLLHLFLLLALSACGIATPSPSPVPSSTATTKSSRLPDPNLVKALLVHVVDEEKRFPGIVVGMIADDPQERWVVGYGYGWFVGHDRDRPVIAGAGGGPAFATLIMRYPEDELVVIMLTNQGGIDWSVWAAISNVLFGEE